MEWLPHYLDFETYSRRPHDMIDIMLLLIMKLAIIPKSVSKFIQDITLWWRRVVAQWDMQNISKIHEYSRYHHGFIPSSIICKISYQNSYMSYLCKIFIENIFIENRHYCCNDNMVQDMKGGFWGFESKRNGQQFMSRRLINCALPKGQYARFVLLSTLQNPPLMSCTILSLQQQCRWPMNTFSINILQRYDVWWFWYDNRQIIDDEIDPIVFPLILMNVRHILDVSLCNNYP